MNAFASEVPAGTWFEQATPISRQEFAWMKLPHNSDYIRLNRSTNEMVIRDSSQVNFWAPFKIVGGEA